MRDTEERKNVLQGMLVAPSFSTSFYPFCPCKSGLLSGHCATTSCHHREISLSEVKENSNCFTRHKTCLKNFKKNYPSPALNSWWILVLISLFFTPFFCPASSSGVNSMPDSEPHPEGQTALISNQPCSAFWAIVQITGPSTSFARKSIRIGKGNKTAILSTCLCSSCLMQAEPDCLFGEGKLWKYPWRV